MSSARLRRSVCIHMRKQLHPSRKGERVIAMLLANATPFCDGWENWEAANGWTIPRFPEGWEELPIG